MTREQLIRDIGKNILRPLGVIQALFLMPVIASPFIWIWDTWALAWKVGLTGLIGTAIVYFLYKTAQEAIIEGVDEAVADTLKEQQLSGNKSAFQDRLEQMAKERGQKTKN